ncbi:5'-methylthioadenosine/S-adenosylhomocysteine nucleosidase [Virgibacillus halodenitrificans]|uniref:5'-methylthioadenosine/S-adenosylhomocysteine nucleosidase n=1 Tax=Virgibacillus halodenitrificans TaxID=1482 RepID=UPI0002DCF7E1|nr:5'-methylthioadenosine/S-adenosylhomocysteine nucleosidase [Virgibacillus halodenitrificans]
MKTSLKALGLLAILLTVVVIGGCGSSNAEGGNSSSEQDDATKPVAVQGAMDVEVSALLDEMEDYKTEQQGGYTFYVGEIDDIPVVVSRTEVGMVHAAASTTLLIDEYEPKAIINQGTAGGHNPNIHVFDTIIGTEVMNIGSIKTDHLDDEKGMEPDSWHFMKTQMREDGDIKEVASFKSDPELVEKAWNVKGKYEYGNVVKGKIGSADVWNREIDRIQWFHEKAGTDAEEMEAASVAQVAEGFDIPYLSIRTVSNSEVTNDDIEDLEKAGQYGAEFAIEVVKEIGK